MDIAVVGGSLGGLTAACDNGTNTVVAPVSVSVSRLTFFVLVAISVIDAATCFPFPAGTEEYVQRVARRVASSAASDSASDAMMPRRAVR